MIDPRPTIEHATARDGYGYAARVWKCDAPVGSVVCLHGIVSHGGWYEPSCAHLAGLGLEVHLPDRRGSGLNRSARGDVDGFETWIRDVTDHLERLPTALPRILLGISWGGTLAAAVARRRPELLAGVGLICPGLYARQSAGAVQRAALRAAGMLGLGGFRVTIPLRDPVLFTESTEAQRTIAEDPLALRKITFRFALANLMLNRYAAEAPEGIRVPSLLVLAGRDRIVQNEQVRAFYRRIGHPSKTILEYPAAAHTLEFERDPSGYFQALGRWSLETAKRANAASSA